MDNPGRVATSVLVGGLRAAYSRFLTSEADTPPAFHAAFEMLAWSGAIRDRFRQEKRAVQPVLNGLWFARNLVLHLGVDVLDWLIILDRPYGDGAYGVGTYGGGITHWTWRYRHELPKSRSDGAEDYDDHLAGRSVVDVFENVINAVD